MTTQNNREYPRIYNFFPRLGGAMNRWYEPIASWRNNQQPLNGKPAGFTLIDHIAEMGFNTVYTNPFSVVTKKGKTDGNNGSLYAIRDHFLVDPAFMPDHSSDRSGRASYETELASIMGSGVYNQIVDDLFTVDRSADQTAIDTAITGILGRMKFEPDIQKYFDTGFRTQQEYFNSIHQRGMQTWGDLVIGHMAVDHPLVLKEQEMMTMIATARTTEGIGYGYNEGVTRDGENSIISINWRDADGHEHTYNPLFRWGGTNRKDDNKLFHREQDGNEWNDAAMINYNNSQTENFFIGFWKSLVTHMLEAGVDGFRCDAAYNISPNIWNNLMKHAYDWSVEHGRNKPVWMAETVGGNDRNRILQNVRDPVDSSQPGFDHALSSETWWRPTHSADSQLLNWDWFAGERQFLNSIAKHGGVGALATHDTHRALIIAGRDHLIDCMRHNYEGTKGLEFCKNHNLWWAKDKPFEFPAGEVKLFLNELGKDDPEREALSDRIVSLAARAALGNNGWMMSMGEEWSAGRRNWVFDPQTSDFHDRVSIYTSPAIPPGYLDELLDRDSSAYDISRRVQEINDVKRSLPAGSREVSRQVVAFAPPDRVMIIRRQLSGQDGDTNAPAMFVIYNTNPNLPVNLEYDDSEAGIKIDFKVNADTQNYYNQPITLNLAALENKLGLEKGSLMMLIHNAPTGSIKDTLFDCEACKELDNYVVLADAKAVKMLNPAQPAVEALRRSAAGEGRQQQI